MTSVCVGPQAIQLLVTKLQLSIRIIPFTNDAAQSAGCEVTATEELNLLARAWDWLVALHGCRHLSIDELVGLQDPMVQLITDL